MFCLSSQLSPEDYREHAYTCMPEEVDIDVSSGFHSCMTQCSIQLYIKGHNSLLFSLQTKLSRLCEQDKVVRTQEDKLQQLYREKVTKHNTVIITFSHKTVRNAHKDVVPSGNKIN